MPRQIKIETAPVFRPLLEPARWKGAHGGRGSGKSWFFADLLIEDCLLNRGLLAVCVREIQKDLSQSAKRLLEMRLSHYGLGEADGFKVYDAKIKTPGDGLIVFQGMRTTPPTASSHLRALVALGSRRRKACPREALTC
jgi:phage terminase large subunit